MKNKAIIFFDIDGTICGYEGVPSLKLQKTFKLLHEQNHAAFLCTGRSNKDIPKEIFDLGFDGIISCMGAEIRIGNECVRHCTIPEELLIETTQQILDQKIAALFLGAEEVLRTQYMKPVERETGCIVKTEDLWKGDSLAEIASIDIEYEEKTVLEKCLESIFKHSDIFEYNECTSQTYLKGVSKENAIREILSREEYKGYVSYAIGDSQNDIGMLQEVNIGIAMGNAPDCVKEKADYVTVTMEEDGVSKALEYFGLVIG